MALGHPALVVGVLGGRRSILASTIRPKIRVLPCNRGPLRRTQGGVAALGFAAGAPFTGVRRSPTNSCLSRVFSNGQGEMKALARGGHVGLSAGKEGSDADSS